MSPISVAKPVTIFNRNVEWPALVTFANRAAAQATLGIVSGRRRMGKTYLLRALVHKLGGFYFAATDATAGESLRQFGAALAEYAASPVRFVFANWDDAIRYLFTLGSSSNGQPVLVVIDEFPYLTKAVPELASVIQREIDEHQTRQSGLRLLLCGSAMSVMGELLASNAPLRGRAGLEMLIRPFGYRDSAQFWGVEHDVRLAAHVHAVVGGTPAYRRQFLADDIPANFADFSDWICRTVLSPLSSLFREARYLLAEETEMRDTSLYHSVLAAI